MITEFLPIIQKYQNIDVDEIDITVTKYEDGVTMGISSNTEQVGDLLSDLMIQVAKLATQEKGKVNVKVIDKRGL